MASKRGQRRRLQQRSCAGKVRHPTARAAKRARAALSAPFLQVYPCGFCGGWHLGHAAGAAARIWETHR